MKLRQAAIGRSCINVVLRNHQIIERFHQNGFTRLKPSLLKGLAVAWPALQQTKFFLLLWICDLDCVCNRRRRLTEKLQRHLKETITNRKISTTAPSSLLKDNEVAEPNVSLYSVLA